MKRQKIVHGVAIFLACAALAPAATIQVGPTRTYTTVAAGYTTAVDGDTIEIDSGTYVGANGWVRIGKNNLTFRGVGATRPVLDANHSATATKGIFVVDLTGSGNLTVENLEFANAYISSGSGGNAAGIRYQPAALPATLTVRNCYFHDNQNGILTNGGTTLDVFIEYSEFNHNGFGDGQSHNMYINNARNFTLQYCYSHDANNGHEVKTRANNNYILYNLLSSENGFGGRNVQLAQGGVGYIIGNVIQKGPNCTNNELIAYGGEGTNTNPYLYVVNNTLVNLRENLVTFLMMNNSTSAGTAVMKNNIIQWRNSQDTVVGGSYAGQVVQTTNWITTNAALSNIGNHDYHLTSASTGAINLGTAPGTGYNSVSLVPVYQYIHPTSIVSRPTDATIDIGAYEYVAPNHPPTVNAGADQKVVEGQAVSLHATASDLDNDPLTYAWTQPAGLPVVLSGGATADASFTAPTVTTIAQAAMTFTATVSDGKAGPVSDSVNVRVYMMGDTNQDDSVDVVDLLTFVAAFGSVNGDPNYDPTCDFNSDNIVDVVDLLDFVDNFGRTLL
jgi:hypothetical protein